MSVKDTSFKMGLILTLQLKYVDINGDPIDLDNDLSGLPDASESDLTLTLDMITGRTEGNCGAASLIRPICQVSCVFISFIFFPSATLTSIYRL